MQQPCHRVVVSAYDRACSLAAVEQTYFTEVVSFSKQSNEIVLYFALVDLIDDAVTNGDEEKLVTGCTLLQNDFFWNGEAQIQFTQDGGDEAVVSECCIAIMFNMFGI